MTSTEDGGSTPPIAEADVIAQNSSSNYNSSMKFFRFLKANLTSQLEVKGKQFERTAKFDKEAADI